MGKGDEDIDPNAYDAEALSSENKSIVMGMIKQLKPSASGMDLSRVTLPTFILEPRSFLERLTDFMMHSHLILDVCDAPSDVERMLSIIRWFLSGWHIRPKGVKKPYNPIMGETCRSSWDHGDKGNTLYVGEQVSHHPPVSAFYFVNRKRNYVMEGHIHPKSRFYGNSAASLMDGKCMLRLLNSGEDYVLSYPSYYVRGILIGTLKMEIAGKAEVRCDKTGLVCELEFKNKGMFRGENNSVSGKIKRGKDTLYYIEGKWDSRVLYSEGKSGEKSVLLDVDPAACPVTRAGFEDTSAMGIHESRSLWSKVTEKLTSGNVDAATEHKFALEDAQRDGAKARKAADEEWTSSLFVPHADGTYSFKHPASGAYTTEEERAEYEKQWWALTKQGKLSTPDGTAP